MKNKLYFLSILAKFFQNGKFSDIFIEDFKIQYSDSINVSDTFDAYDLIQNNILQPESPLKTVCSIVIKNFPKKGYNQTSAARNFYFVQCT